MPPAAVNAIPQPQAPSQMSMIDTNPGSFSLRDFVVDDDAANFTASLWKSIDQTAFVLAQREALEAFNVAKAMRLSEETAAEENHRRATAAVSSSASSSASASKPASTSASAYTTPTITVTIAPPESKTGTSSASDSAKQKSPAISYHDRKPSSSASAQAFASRPSLHPRLSLSTHIEPSRVTNSVPSSSASQSLRIEQRSLSKREPESPVTKLSISMSPSALSSTQHSSSSASTSTSHTQAPDATSFKRRRTERQPSISPNTPSTTQQPQQQLLVVPPIIDSQKSTASVHLVNPPSTPVEARSRRRSTAKSPTSSKPLAEPRDVFMTTRSCTKCGTPVPSPRSQSLAESSINLIPLLHVTCTKCHTMYCRGCFTVARCNRALVLASSISRSTSTSARPPTSATPSECSGGSTCTVRSCCPAVRAIAIFEALSAFDDSFAAEAGFRSDDRKGKGQSKEHRDAYVRQIIGGKPGEKDKAQGNGARRFEDAFVRALKAVSAWLQAPNSDDDDDYAGKGKDADGHTLHATIPRLFETSLLLEVIHVFLGNTNVRDWVAHAETYLAILDLLRWMLDASTAIVQSQAAAPRAYAVTLKSLLRAPMRRIEATSGLRRAVWGDGNVRFEDVGGAASDPAAPAPGRERTRSLCDLIKNLEGHRRPLMALASKATFEATVDKVNSLCDGILYLLLQQVVDEI